MAAAEMDVRSRRLRGDDRLGLGCPVVVYVADEAGDADFAIGQGGDGCADGLVAADMIHPLNIAHLVVLGDEGVAGMIRVALSGAEARLFDIISALARTSQPVRPGAPAEN